MINNFPYPAIMRPLFQNEGIGYIVEFPDLPGCYADGETLDEALREAENAFQS